MTVAGFGSLLSERSARSTFPELSNFRLATIAGWRRVFAHTAGAALLRCHRHVSALSQALFRKISGYLPPQRYSGRAG